MITSFKNRATFLVAALALSSVFLVGCSLKPAPVDPEAPLTNAALKVVTALKNKDGATLAKLSNSVMGVRFSPYAHINLSKDIVLSTEALVGVFTDPTTQTWGTAAGSGEPITLTFANYYNKFIYDQDFANPAATGINTIIGTGNMINNLTTAYTAAQFVEYHFPGFDPKYDGMDWVSLRLVFDGDLKLIGVVHDQWTP